MVVWVCEYVCPSLWGYVCGSVSGYVGLGVCVKVGVWICVCRREGHCGLGSSCGYEALVECGSTCASMTMSIIA